MKLPHDAEVSTSLITDVCGPVLVTSGSHLVALDVRLGMLVLWAAGQSPHTWIRQGRIRPLCSGAHVRDAVAEARLWLLELEERATRNFAHAHAFARTAPGDTTLGFRALECRKGLPS